MDIEIEEHYLMKPSRVRYRFVVRYAYDKNDVSITASEWFNRRQDCEANAAAYKLTQDSRYLKGVISL